LTTGPQWRLASALSCCLHVHSDVWHQPLLAYPQVHSDVWHQCAPVIYRPTVMSDISPYLLIHRSTVTSDISVLLLSTGPQWCLTSALTCLSSGPQWRLTSVCSCYLQAHSDVWCQPSPLLSTRLLLTRILFFIMLLPFLSSIL
jgi:hypothetical protein